MAHPPFYYCDTLSFGFRRSTGMPAEQTCAHSWLAPPPPKSSARSTGLPRRRVAEQAAVGKADAVDQDHPEDEADQTRCHAEPPIEFRQIDRCERKRRQKNQRDQHHSDDGAEPKQQ